MQALRKTTDSRSAPGADTLSRIFIDEESMKMLPIPGRLTGDTLDWLHHFSGRDEQLKVSLFVELGSTPEELESMRADCLRGGSELGSSMLLRAVLQHLCSTAAELLSHHGSRLAGFACFAMLDGSVHDDMWIELEQPVACTLTVANRFVLEPLARPVTMPVPRRTNTNARIQQRESRQAATWLDRRNRHSLERIANAAR